MLSTSHYLLRSKQDGQYLVARVRDGEDKTVNYVLVFQESYDALSYLNAHAPDLAANFSVETLSPNQLQSVIKRWGFYGIGLVTEPREPRVNFLTYDKGFNI